jgi:hypothetical protein
LFFKMIKFYKRFSYHKKTNYEIIIFVTFSNMRLMLECDQISYQFQFLSNREWLNNKPLMYYQYTVQPTCFDHF